MPTEKCRQRAYWNGLAELPPDTSVIDPRDTRGHKNAYIASIRDEAILSTFRKTVDANGVVLDFGCGTGSASLCLLRQGYHVLGLDIALSLLRHARQRCDAKKSLFAAVGGDTLPVARESLDAAVTYVVLSYVVEDADVMRLLRAIHTSLKPGARLVAIEQCRKSRTVIEGGLKIHRPIEEWCELLRSAGFKSVESGIVRSGRFPMIPLIRQGWIPRLFWPVIRRAERLLGRTLLTLSGDYVEVTFEGIA